MIVTRKLAATETLPARVRASGYGIKAETTYPHGSDGSDAHKPAALLVAQQYHPGEKVDVAYVSHTPATYKFRIIRPE